ncbi:MAG: MFS transporter [Ardenticatenaceae bacterium]
MKEFNWRFAFLIGFTAVISNTFWPVFNTYVPIFLQSGHPLWEGAGENTQVTGFALSPTLAYFIMTWDNLLHIFLTPWAGSKSDRTWNRFGRRLPWVLVGLPLALIGFVFIPYATSLAAIMLFILLTNLGTGIFRAPLRAWIGDFFQPADRAKADSATQVMGALAVVVVLVIGGRMFDRISPSAPFWLAALVVLMGTIPILLFVREEKNVVKTPQLVANQSTLREVVVQMFRSPERNVLFAFLGTFFLQAAQASYQAGVGSFGVFELNITAGRVSQLVGMAAILYMVLVVPCGLLATRFGPRRVMMTGMFLYVASNILIALFAQSEADFFILLLVYGTALPLILVGSLTLFLNTDQGHNTGVFTGLYFVAFQLASVVGPLLTGALIQLAGTQRMMWYVAGTCMTLAFVCISRVTERHFSKVEVALSAD